MSRNFFLQKIINRFRREIPEVPQSLASSASLEDGLGRTPEVPQSLASSIPLEDEPMWPAQPFSLPIPNAILREASSIAQMDAFFAIGEAWAQLVSYFLPPGPINLLDIGCGCGKQTRFFYLNPNINYVGVDIYLPAIKWCQRAFAQLGSKRFRFEHFDGYSKTYNPNGKIKASEYNGSLGIPGIKCLFKNKYLRSFFPHCNTLHLNKISVHSMVIRHKYI